MNALTHTKPAKSSIIRARCCDELKSLTQRAAAKLEIDESDVLRIALKEYTGRILFAPVNLHG
jgi:antitoxin component of RelBE/YafQ-DinJ toxin-antitoxin module